MYVFEKKPENILGLKFQVYLPAPKLIARVQARNSLFIKNLFSIISGNSLEYAPSELKTQKKGGWKNQNKNTGKKRIKKG